MPCSPSSAWVTSMSRAPFSAGAFGSRISMVELVAADDVLLGAELASHLGLAVLAIMSSISVATEQRAARRAPARGCTDSAKRTGSSAIKRTSRPASTACQDLAADRRRRRISDVTCGSAATLRSISSASSARCPVQDLHQKPAGGADGAVGVDEHAERRRRRHLLGGREIVRDVLGDLAGDELHDAAVGLLVPRLGSHDAEETVADGAGDVELAVLRRQVRRRPRDVAAHLAVCRWCVTMTRRSGPSPTSSIDRRSSSFIVAPSKQPGRERSAERRGGGRDTCRDAGAPPPRHRS